MYSSKYKNEKQIIFTRYSESEKCILDVHNKTDYKIFVYDRGKEKLNLPVSDRIVHIYDENNGREDGGYLRHIIDNYNNYSGIVVFSQADYGNHSWTQLDGAMDKWLNELSETSYKSYVVNKLSCDKDGNPHHFGLPLETVWKKIFDKDPPENYSFFPCSIFSTSWSTIRDYPIDFYKKIYDLTSIKNNSIINNHQGLQIPWCLERFWEYIFKKNKYDLSHLVQHSAQNVLGPIQDDEALFLYSIIRGMRLKTVLEVGFGDGYSAKNFLKAVDGNGLVISIEIGNIYKIQENHIPICKDASLIERKDLPIDKLDFIFFDCHHYDAQMILFNRLKDFDIITDDTILALHDTNTWPKNYRYGYDTDQGWVHQPAERKMVNYFCDIGYSPFCLHTRPEVHNEDFPFRHGVTVMKKFKTLSI